MWGTVQLCRDGMEWGRHSFPKENHSTVSRARGAEELLTWTRTPEAGTLALEAREFLTHT
jgi:hypothetical protein